MLFNTYEYSVPLSPPVHDNLNPEDVTSVKDPTGGVGGVARVVTVSG